MGGYAGPARVVQGHFPAGRPSFHGHAPATTLGTATAVPAAAGLQFPAGGHPLPPVVRQKMERAFGTSFAHVRVHVGSQAAAIGASAFTSGSSIFFAPGRYDPHSANGMRLLAHELSHVVQQKTGKVRSPFPNGIAIVHDPRLEAEAEQMSARIAQEGHAAVQPKAAPVTAHQAHAARVQAIAQMKCNPVAPGTAHQAHFARLQAIAQMKRNPAAPARVVQRSESGLQDLSIYELPKRILEAISEIQKVLASPTEVKKWMDWLTLQTNEIHQRLGYLKDSDSWISAYSDVPRNEKIGTSLGRWKKNKQKALDLALWRIEQRWMKKTPSRQTLYAERGTNASAFSDSASEGNALKDVGAPLLHGEYPHRIQWYIIYRHLSFKGFSNQEIYDTYQEMVKKKHIRILDTGKLRKPNDVEELSSDEARSLWDRVVDIRLSERNTGVHKAYWGSPLAVTYSLRPKVKPPKDIPENIEQFEGPVAEAVSLRVKKRQKQKELGVGYFSKDNHPNVDQLNLGRELVNRSLAEKFNLY